MNSNFLIVMAGGVGSRFWPYSKTSKPKQFHDILGTGKSLLQETMDRFDGLIPRENRIVVTNEKYRDLVLEQIPWIEKDNLLLEPMGRNTAPCVSYAAHKLLIKDPNANMVVCPSDHVILKNQEFLTIISQALKETAEKDILVTLGIKPQRPDTGYGYIQFLEEMDGPLQKVKTFTEKPTLEFAQKFIESGDFLWNSGIFIWSAQAVVKSMSENLPEVDGIFAGGSEKYFTDGEAGFIHKAYSHSKSISIDYGVMEKASNVWVIPGDFGWSDLGTWKSLYELSEKGGNGNVIHGEVKDYNLKNCMIQVEDGKLLVAQGLEDYIVVVQGDAIMICQREQEQMVKAFVEDVKKDKNWNDLA